jgi:hypothetical protein
MVSSIWGQGQSKCRRRQKGPMAWHTVQGHLLQASPSPFWEPAKTAPAVSSLRSPGPAPIRWPQATRPELPARLGTLRRFLFLPNSSRPNRATLPASALTTAPAPWGPFGVVSAMGDTHAPGTLQLRREKGQNVRAGATTRVTGFPAPRHKLAAPCRHSAPGEERLPQHLRRQEYLSPRPRSKRAFQKDPSRGRSFGARPWRADQRRRLPVLPRRKWSFHFRRKRRDDEKNGSCAQSKTGNVVFALLFGSTCPGQLVSKPKNLSTA